nr:MarR family transcriptional regulator [uncultured Holophaga sp.]
MPTPNKPQKTASLLIMAAKRRIRHMVAARFREAKLTDQQALILESVREAGSICLTELASHIRLDHPTVSRLIHGLEQQGLLVITPDPEQRRKVIIRLDERQRPYLDEIHELALDYRAKLEAGLSEEEKRIFRICLGKVLDNLDRMEAEAQVPGGSRGQGDPDPEG